MAGEIEIRHAIPRDGAALLAAAAQIDRETEFLGVPGQPHPWAGRPEVELRSLAESGRGTVLLALTGGGEIAGYLSAFAGHFARNRGNIFIAVIGLREAWRGRGIGTRLLETIEAWAARARRVAAGARVSSLNRRGQALYRKRGLAVEGRIRGGVFRRGSWTDDLWMGKLLDPLPGLAPAAEQYVGFAARAAASGDQPSLRAMREGDGRAFRAWDRAMAEALPCAIKQPDECAAVEAIERDIAAVPDDPRLWLTATVPQPGDGERIVGLGSGKIEFGFRMQHDAFVNVAVLPDWCGRGLGRRLHDEIASWAVARGARRLTAAIQAPNHAGRAFAAALGYDEEVTMRCYSLIDGRMVDRIRASKLLV